MLSNEAISIIYLVAAICSCWSLQETQEKVGGGKLTKFTYLDKTYEIQGRKTNWYDAKIDCALKGQELLSVETYGEHASVQNEMKKAGYGDEGFWTSGFAYALFGYASQEFYWDSTGHNLGPYETWEYNERPSNLTMDTCVLISDAYTVYWDVTNDTDTCQNLNLWYICETLTQPTIPQELFEESSDSRRFEFDGTYYEISELMLDWFGAKYDCRRRGMELLSIESAAENDAIYNEIAPYEQDFWISGWRFKNLFYWDSTGHGVGPYENWAPGYPIDFSESNCIVIKPRYNYTWQNFKCAGGAGGTTMKRYICEY
ncbi:macrophage mannose receptor 1-like [Neocloeon triangulifer]|uniref:macrophage mannose receptor 1-like n=1 Tax=Neocloeon triangulifer TaxID=2078957 RepID=UPI00286EE53A|nr:macrophage mannose receptor 1-like [Neocloeon triangulifer]